MQEFVGDIFARLLCMACKAKGVKRARSLPQSSALTLRRQNRGDVHSSDSPFVATDRGESPGALTRVRLPPGGCGAGARCGSGAAATRRSRSRQRAEARHKTGEQLMTFLTRVLLKNLIPDKEKSHTFPSDLQGEVRDLRCGSVDQVQ